MVQLGFATVLLALASSSLASQCFYPAGNPARSDVPCNPSAAVSTCCSSQSQCLSNGLCRVDSDPNTVHFARGSCTDAGWGPGCFSQCHARSYTGNPVMNIANVYACNSTGWTDPAGASYCCETAKDQGTGCCSGSTFWLPAGAASSTLHPAGFLQESSSSSSSSSSTSSTSSSSSTSSTSSSTSTSCTSTYVASSTALGNSSATYTPILNSTVVMPSPTNGTIVSTAAPIPPTGTTGAAVNLRTSLGMLVGALAVAVAL